MNFTFDIVSPKHGTFTVTAPERFRAEIEAHTWHINRDASTRFDVRTNVKGTNTRLTRLQLHRLVWRLMGREPVAILDHKDRNPLNNAEDNLRDGTKGNTQNREKQRNNNSGITGVSRHPKSDGWMVYVGISGKPTYFGFFKDRTEAQIVRDAAALKHHGEFAVLNPPPYGLTPDEYRALLACV